jgi:dolichol-phosphate mannosyltransferase
MHGAKVVEVPVAHRPRRTGRSNYGILDRAASGLLDCLAVCWMLRRHRAPAARPLP